MAENQLEGSVLGVAWDGTGFGPDGTIWGGEFLIPDNGTFFRFASFNLFPLPGGEKAVREPRRSAAGMLVDLPEDANDLLATMFSGEELKLVGQMIAQKINSPLTSSVGRMFDAVAAIIGIRTKCSFEGQSAMELEYAADRSDDESVYPYSIDDLGTLPVNGQCRPRLLIDWCPMLSAILADCRRSAEQRTIARKFHNTLAEMILDVSKRSGERRIVLTGGCFQNKLLLETAVRRLSEEDFQVYFHQRVPPNDGGISLGQLAATMRLAHIVPVVAYHTKENDHVPGSTRKSP
jgi:hydrogenase maturation protein HypF